MTNTFTQRNMMMFDLFLTSLFGLAVWHTPMRGLFPLSLVLLRLFATFSLQEKEKGNWLLVVLNALWLVPLAASNERFIFETYIIYPVAQLIKTFMLFIGYSGLSDVRRFLSMEPETSQEIIVKIMVILASLFYYLWLLLYPVAVYIRQWRRKEFTDTRAINGRIGLIVGYMIAVLVLSCICDSYFKFIGQYHLWLFLMALLPFAMFLKEKRPMGDTCRMYLKFVTIFYCAYILGTEMGYSNSFIGLLLPVLFYRLVCRTKGVHMQYRDYCILLIASVAFMVAQYGCNWVRVLFLSISAVAYGYEAYVFFRSGQSKRLAFAVFIATGFILPTLALGYNQYTVLDARKISISADRGVLRTYNPSTYNYGLRDRYGELVPCEYDQLALIDHYNTSLVKVRLGKYWGFYDIEEGRMAVEPVYVKVEKESKNYLRLITEEGSISYMQLRRYGRSRSDDEESWRIVDYPSEELMNERLEPVEMTLVEKNVENRPHISCIYNYIVSTYCEAKESYDAAGSYWAWAEKCTNMIESVATENNIFTGDTARASEQAIDRINEMLSINGAGSQSSMNSYSLVRGATEFYLAIDNNHQLAKMDSLSWKNGFKEEYELWMDFYLKSYSLYEDVILKEESYSSLPQELDSILTVNAEWRTKMVKEYIAFLSGTNAVAYCSEDITEAALKAFIRKMDDNGDEPCFADELRVSMLKWLRHRDNMLKNMAPGCREAFANQTKRIKWDLRNFLKQWSDDFEAHKDSQRLRAKIAEDESDEILLNE